MGRKTQQEELIQLAKAKKIQQNPAQADVSDLAILETVKDLQNCTMAHLHQRLVRGKTGATMLDLGRNRERLIEAGHLERIDHFTFRVSKTGEERLVELRGHKEKGQLQPA